MNWTEAILLMATGARSESWKQAALRVIGVNTGIKDLDWLANGCNYDDVGEPIDVRQQYENHLASQPPTAAEEAEF